jgi:exosome complex component CSL4
MTFEDAPKERDLRISEGSIVTPGDRIGSVRSHISGEGTYCRGGHIMASRVGRLKISSTDGATKDEKSTKSSLYIVSVVQSKSTPACHQIILNQQLVICRVTRLHLSHVVVQIVATILSDGGGLQSVIVGGNSPPEGMIRREDVKSSSSSSSSATEPNMDTWFRPDDWILGRIVSLGDTRRYWISTAEPELGVIRMTQEDEFKETTRKRAKLTATKLEQLIFGTKLNTKDKK